MIFLTQFFMDSFEPSTHIFQGYFIGYGAIIWLPQSQWNNPEGYGQNDMYPSRY